MQLIWDEAGEYDLMFADPYSGGAAVQLLHRPPGVAEEEWHVSTGT